MDGVEIKSQSHKEFQTENVILAGPIVESEHMIVYGGQIEAYRVNSFRPVVPDQWVKNARGAAPCKNKREDQ